jgi:hypothetical protein
LAVGNGQVYVREAYDFSLASWLGSIAGHLRVDSLSKGLVCLLLDAREWPIDCYQGDKPGSGEHLGYIV